MTHSSLKTRPTVTIGIPAYNEAANIGQLLSALLLQKINYGQLQQILVVSDASTDATDSIVSSFQAKNKKISFIRQEKRIGNSVIQNIIAEKAEGDILVMLDADILPDADAFIDKIIGPLSHGESGMVSGRIVPARPKTFVEKVLARNHIFKTNLFERINNHLYLTFGPARAFSKDVYTSLRYPEDCPTDAYSYMYCHTNGIPFYYVHDATVTFRCPDTLADHIKQSERFISSKKAMEINFNSAIVKKSYRLPFGPLFSACFWECVCQPLYFCVYICITLYVSTLGWVRGRKMFDSQWSVSGSSKKI